jgi:hypothetical protein
MTLDQHRDVPGFSGLSGQSCLEIAVRRHYMRVPVQDVVVIVRRTRSSRG